MAQPRTWLDAMTDGQIIRDWFSLFAQFGLGVTYISFFITLYMVSIGLSFVLIGIPLLLFSLAATRAIANMDQRLFAAILNQPPPQIDGEFDLRGANFGERLGMVLGSMTTWRSLAYLALKFPVGMLALLAGLSIVPLLAIEMLLMGPLGIDMRLASPRLLHALAVGMHKFPGLLLPAAKRKRDYSRLEADAADEPEYYLDDDGEIVMRERV